MNKIEYINPSSGMVVGDNQFFTFEIQGASISEDKAAFSTLFTNDHFRLGNYIVGNFGTDNIYPFELRDAVKANHLLPELLEKQIRFLYGQGPTLFSVGSENQRVAVQDTEIQNWLDSWVDAGLKDYRVYLQNIIRDYYYTEGQFTQYIFNKSRRLGTGRVVGLEHIQIEKCRLASDKSELIHLYNDDYNYIAVGNWNFPSTQIKFYPRFIESKPFANQNPINYTINRSFGEELYSYPAFYEGLKYWIKGSNLTPKFINSFLENSLAAKLHVVIPYTWVQQKENRLKAACENNRELAINNLPIVQTYNGVSIGTEYRQQMILDLINNELRTISNYLSGADQQGKVFSSWAFTTPDGKEEWEFKEIPMKYKEYISSLIEHHRRADEVILEGKGLDASISNVSKEGVISKSGSDAYYNYMIYQNGLTIPEFICCYDINRALRINFPDKKNITLGFYRSIPDRQQDITPSKRIENNIN
jgi:hypothetical protein